MKLRLLALGVVALAAAGCGQSSCPTETPKVQRVASCTVQPGAQVKVNLELCPTCNQNPTSCRVDLTDVGSGTGQIFLDPLAEVCDAAGCTPESSPACAVSGPSCTFVAPAVEGNYTLTAYSLSGQVNGTLTVSSSQSPSCTL